MSLIGDFSIPPGYHVVYTLVGGAMVPVLTLNNMVVSDDAGTAVLTAADLRAIPSDRLKNGDTRVVATLGTVFMFNTASTATDDGATVLKPTDGLQKGAWVALATTANAAALTAANAANAALTRTGNATLVTGTKAVADTSVTASTVVMLSRKTAGGTLGNLTYTVSAGVGFTITSTSGTDTSVVSYHLLG